MCRKTVTGTIIVLSKIIKTNQSILSCRINCSSVLSPNDATVGKTDVCGILMVYQLVRKTTVVHLFFNTNELKNFLTNMFVALFDKFKI